MGTRYFRSLKEIMERYFPRKVELEKIEMETPKESGERIVAEVIGSTKKLLMEDEH